MIKYDEYIKKYPQMKESVGECPMCGAVCFPCECGCGILICSEDCEVTSKRGE